MGRRVTTRTYEYDEQGRITKETVVDEDVTQPGVVHVTPQPYQPWTYPPYRYTFGGAGVVGKPVVTYNSPGDV